MCRSVSRLSVGLYFGGVPARVSSGDKAGSGVGKRLEMKELWDPLKMGAGENEGFRLRQVFCCRARNEAGRFDLEESKER